MTKTKKPSAAMIRKATRAYADALLENGYALKWAKHAIKRGVKLTKGRKDLDTDQLAEVEFAIHLTHGVYEFGFQDEPIDVSLALCMILDELLYQL